MLAKSYAEVTVTLPSEREIAFTRIFERPRSLVFEAWTKAEHMRQWWGCEGSSVPVCEIDFRVGGAWQMVMHLPNGSDHAFHGVYREIVRDERLVFTECYDNPQIGSPEWLTTITFEEVAEGTRLTHTILHRSREVRDGHLQAGMEEGTKQIMQHLDDYCSRMAEESVHP